MHSHVFKNVSHSSFSLTFFFYSGSFKVAFPPLPLPQRTVVLIFQGSSVANMHLAVAGLTINSSVLHACQKEMQTATRSVTHFAFSSQAGISGLHCVLSCIILLAHPYFPL